MTMITQSAPAAFDSAVSDLKIGVETATRHQRDAADTAMKAASDVAAFGKDSLAAFVEAGQIASSGWQALAQDATKASQAAFDQFKSGARAFFAAKSVRERLDIQTGFMRAAAETAVAESSRLARAGIDLNARVAAPLLARAAVAADTFKV